jgi:trk system potassium uptake protein TrkH
MQPSEALLVTALAYFATSAAMVWPLMAASDSALDAWFESVSAVTTTGLSMIAHPENSPPALIFLRAWMQWYGGLGIAVLSVALLAADDISVQRLVGQVGTEGLVATTRIHARRMVAVYGALTLLAVASIAAAGASWFDAICHAFAAVSTGGFSTREASLAAFPGWQVPAAVTVMSLLGAVSLPLYYFAYRRDWGRVLRDEELRVLAALAVIVPAGFYLLQYGLRLDSTSDIGDALIMGVSAQSTTGFASLSVGDLGAATKIWLLLAMTCGGGIGSTAGGVKLMRVIIVARLLQLSLRRFAMPQHAVAVLRVGGQVIDADAVARAMLTILLFLLVVMLSWIAFVVAGYDPLNALFEVTSATGTVGLSTGLTDPSLSPLLKAVLCLDMLCGRVEIVAMIVLVYPAMWWGKRGGAT